MWGAAFAKNDDLFYCNTETDKRWIEITKRREEVILNDDIGLITSQIKFNDSVKIGLAGISKASTYRPGYR